MFAMSMWHVHSFSFRSLVMANMSLSLRVPLTWICTSSGH